MSFEEQITRLEEIVAALEKGDAQLADSLALFEEGTKLAASCTAMLDEAEQKVRILRRTAEGDIRPADFSEPDAADGEA